MFVYYIFYEYTFIIIKIIFKDTSQVVSPRLLERTSNPHNFFHKNSSNQLYSGAQTNFQNSTFGSFGRPPSITTPILLTPRTPAFFPAPGVLETPTLLRQDFSFFIDNYLFFNKSRSFFSSFKCSLSS